MADRYAIAAGNFSDPAIWSVTNGGAGGASVPGPADDVFTDSDVVTIDQAISVNSWTHSSAVNLPTSNAVDITLDGSTYPPIPSE